MKKVLLNLKSVVITFVIATLFVFSTNTIFAIDYYSSGNTAPNLVANWWTATNGTGGHPANFTIAGNRFIIQNAHTMTTTAVWTVTGAGSSIQINTGGILVASNAVTAPAITVASGATYRHNQNGGTVPAATWDANSTCNITGITTTIAAGLTQTFGNLTYNCTGQNTDEYFDGAINVAGNFTISSTGTGTLRVSSNGTPRIVTVGGNFSQTTGEFRLNNSTGGVTMTVGGNLSLSGTALFTLVSGAANSSVTVAGDVSVTTGELRMSEDNNTGTLNIAGDFTHSGGTITETSTGAGAIIFNGSSAQTYTGGGTLSNTINYTVNNAAGVSLANSVTLPAGLTLTSGELTIATGATLTIANGNIIGGTPFSATKHIVTAVNTTTGAQGFLRVNNMAQSVAYVFPVGDGTNYLPATLNPSSATAGNRTFSVCAFNGITTNGTPNGTAFTAEQKARCVDAVWTITYNGAGAPTSAATTVATAWPATLEGANFALVANALIGIAHYDGPAWGTAVGSGNNGTNVATRANVTTFSPFAVGIISAGGAPLAVKVNYFNAAKGNGVNTLNWNAACSSTQATFEIERSADGINFSTINSITASQARCDAPFNYDDIAPLAGTNYYRIKIIDANGTVSYTSKVKVNGLQKDMQLVGVLPNPVSNTAQLNITTTKKDKVELSIVSFDGKVMYRNTVALQAGSSYINLEVSGIATGTYFVKGVFADGQVSTVKFIKQ